MRDSTADTREEDVIRTKGVQDHKAGPFTKFIFWRTKRRYGRVLLSTRIRANDPKLLALAELMSRYTSASRGPRPKAKRVGATQSRGNGRLSAMNRYSFCRGQKNRNHGRTIE